MTWHPDRDDPPWWATATGYQIYPRSFCDSNGDGIGDIPGITSKLDHLEELGAGFIWLSPVFASPMRDNGYDIADYRAIAPEFGTMDDFETLLVEAKNRGIRIIMDLVVNHSSSDHPWFQTACADPVAAEHDYYIWRTPGPDGGPPDDCRACFGGPAWTFVPSVGKYYFHFFSPGQPDLNWQNPKLRAEIYEMMNAWVDKGVAGFRMDVIDLIGKDVDAQVYQDGPQLHAYLQEMHQEVLAGKDLLTVGESWSVTSDTALEYCGRERAELDTMFHFNHISAFWHPQHNRWQPQPIDLVALKSIFFQWQSALSEDGWNTLFLSNHDLPRQVSKYGDAGVHRVASAKMLATLMHMMKGTPYIYQGEEIGMTNTLLRGPEDLWDVESLGQFKDRTDAGLSVDDFMDAANAEGREHGRTPMQWSGGQHAGFTTGAPWAALNPNYPSLNVAADKADPDGIFAHYQQLVGLRKSNEVIAFGDFTGYAAEHPSVIAFTRQLDDSRISILVNFTADPILFEVPKALQGDGHCLIQTHGLRTQLAPTVTLEPYEAFAIEMNPD